MTTEPELPSVILRATHILLLRADSVEFGDWQPHESHQLHRDVRITFTLEDTLKGSVVEQPGDRFDVAASQFKSSSMWHVPVPGVWSKQNIERGRQFLAFCRDSGKVAAALLKEPACQLVTPADESLVGVRHAVRAESDNLSIADLLAEATPDAMSLDFIFAGYLSVKISGEAFFSKTNFEAVLSFLENARLPAATRSALLASVRTTISTSNLAQNQHVCRLVITMFRLIDLPEAADLHDNITEVFLPNLLGLKGGAKKCDVNEVFKDYSTDRAAAERLLREHTESSSNKQLLDWLR